MAARCVIALNKNWEFKQADKADSSFLPVSRFPTQIHLDLLAHQLIPDPFVGKNELDVQWIGEVDWVYKTTFPSPAVSENANATLVFDGLDTVATVVLNGAQILETDNMFLPIRVPVKSVLKPEGETNELVITFASAYLEGWRRVEKFPHHKWGCWNGDVSRLAVRKSQYHWGWDWGPTLLTCGPWRPVNLEIFETRISDVWCTTKVEDSLKEAMVSAHATVDGQASKARFALSLDGSEVASETVDVRDGSATATFKLGNPSLWYPIRYGKQPLYVVKAVLTSQGDEELDSASRKFGVRKAELVQRPMRDQPGTSFFFQVNNVPIYCGGSNWIPADNFFPRISRERYRDWVRLVAEGNQFMIRVWGGGIYEADDFYDACDEMGILVWQDFMFSCGNYPAWPEMLESIKREATENVRRLRHHPSIVIWAGNNEDYQYAESTSLTYDVENKDEESWLKSDFPARYIYEKILRDVCEELIPDTYYHFGSPWSGNDTRDPTVGDIHQWNVWHGTQEKYQNFDKLVGRFVSEFGMEAFPSVKTIDAYLPQGEEDPDRYAQSSTVDFHNKADGHERRIALYLVENIRYAPDPLEHFVYSTQLMQAECIASAYRLWKRQWKGPGREYCAGALVWQINDCWPVTSWAICDYYLRPKHAYFTVKREMAPISIGITRREHRHARDKYTRVHVDVTHQLEVWGSNLTLEDMMVDCVIKAWDVETGQETYCETVSSGLELRENRSTEIVAMPVPVRKRGGGDEARTVVAAYLLRDGKQIARCVNWPEPLKYLHLANPRFLNAHLVKDARVVEVGADTPVKGLVLECEDDDVKFDDNMVDVVPGEVVSIKVEGANKGSVITTRHLGMLT